MRLYPKLTEDKDYRVPSKYSLKRWRRILEPLCHFIALSALDRTNIIHLLLVSDATTKRHVGVFHINAKIEVKEVGGTVMQDIPLKFKVPYIYSLLIMLPYLFRHSRIIIIYYTLTFY